MTIERIAILGCGWMGLPIAVNLREKGYRIHGATTTPSKLLLLEEKEIEPFMIHVSEKGIEGDINSFLETDLLYINIPPRRIEPSIARVYPTMIRLILNSVAGTSLKGIIFISATSVYGSSPRPITEKDGVNPQTASGEALVSAERLIQQQELPWIIIRLSGLIGKQRHPVKFLAGKQNITQGNEVVNLIHLEDCIGLTYKVIQQQPWGEIFNGVAGKHPSRKAYYTHTAQKYGLPLPEFAPDFNPPQKWISNKKSIHYLYYHYQYPDPDEMPVDL